MPVTADNIEQAKKIEEELNQKLTSLKQGDPDFDRTNTNLTNLRSGIQEYTKSATKVNESGHLTEDAPTSYKDVHFVEGEGTPRFAYEPPVDVVKNLLRSNPELGKQLNITSWTDSPDQIEKLNEQSTAYQVVADHLWNQNAQRAKKEGFPAYRYSKISFGEDPGKSILGLINKHVPAFLYGADDTMSLGAVQKLGGIAAEAAGDDNVIAEQEEQKNYVSPYAALAGNIFGYTRGGMGSLLARSGAQALKYGSRGGVGKLLTGALAGAGSSVVEGAGQDVVRDLTQGTVPDISQLEENSYGRGVFGLGGGFIGEVLGGVARNASKSMRANNPTTQMVKNLEDAGGRVTVDPINPLSVPENISKNLEAATEARGVRSATGIAADKVAPRISESLERQVRETYNQAGESLEKYHSSPQGMTPKRVTHPVKFMIDYLTKGRRVSDVGSFSDATPQTANEIRKKLLNEIDVKDVTVDQYQSLKERYGDDIISLKTEDADFLLGRQSKPTVQPGQDVSSTEFGNNPFKQNPFRAGPVSEINHPLGLPDGTPGLPEPMPNAGELGSGIPQLPASNSALSTLQNNKFAIQTTGSNTGLSTVSNSAQRAAADPNKVTVIIPRSSNSRQLEMMQQELGSLLQTTDEGWVRQLDESFRQVRDKFDPLPGVTPSEAILDDGTKVFGLSALQRMHSQAFDKMNEVVKETGSNSNRNIYNKVKGFGTDDVSDPFLLEEARKLDNPQYSRAKFSDIDSLAQDTTNKFQSLQNVEKDSVNRYIRRKDTNQLLSGQDPAFESVLSKLQVYNPTKLGSLHRGQSINQNELNKIIETGEYVSNSHIPTTYSPDMAAMYPLPRNVKAGEVPVTFRFKSVKSGSPMMIDEATSNVEEVIIPKGKYKVLGSSVDENGRKVIDLSNSNVEQDLFEVAGTRVAPILDQMVGIPTSFRGLKQNLEVRSLPLLEAVGGVDRNPFINNPNTPQGRIQKYLFEDTAKNLMNSTQGGYGRFGNEVYDEAQQ